MPPFTFPTQKHMKKTTTSTATIVDPTGVPARIDIIMPLKALLILPLPQMPHGKVHLQYTKISLAPASPQEGMRKEQSVLQQSMLP